MPIVIFVEKSGTLKEMKLKEVVPDDLYRKASFKTSEGFDAQAVWSQPDRFHITLYARKTGRPGSENKYDFPPPVDSELFFGGCILTNQDAAGRYIDLTKQAWKGIYEELFGGFEDLDEESDSDDDDDESDDNVPKTKEGYAKDGFIVDEIEDVEESDTSDEESELDDAEDTDDLCGDDEVDTEEEDVSDSEVEIEDDEDEDEDEDFYGSDGEGEAKPKTKKPAKKAVAKKGGKGVGSAAVAAPPIVSGTKRRTPAVTTRSKASATSKKVAVPEQVSGGDGYLNCSDELEEEAYLE